MKIFSRAHLYTFFFIYWYHNSTKKPCLCFHTWVFVSHISLSPRTVCALGEGIAHTNSSSTAWILVTCAAVHRMVCVFAWLYCSLLCKMPWAMRISGRSTSCKSCVLFDAKIDWSTKNTVVKKILAHRQDTSLAYWPPPMWKPEAVTSAGRGNHHDLLTTSATSTSSSESKKTDVSYLGSPQTKMEDRYIS